MDSASTTALIVFLGLVSCYGYALGPCLQTKQKQSWMEKEGWMDGWSDPGCTALQRGLSCHRGRHSASVIRTTPVGVNAPLHHLSCSAMSRFSVFRVFLKIELTTWCLVGSSSGLRGRVLSLLKAGGKNAEQEQLPASRKWQAGSKRHFFVGPSRLHLKGQYVTRSPSSALLSPFLGGGFP